VATDNCVVSNLEPTRFSHLDLGIPGLGTVKKANWRFLPQPASISAEDLIRALGDHFAELNHDGSLNFDLDRIKFALKLSPAGICVGIDEFAGYYAFLFPNDVVLFECPVLGNAAFVVKGDWRVLSQQYKARLQRISARVIHRRFWRQDIKNALANLRT
jgi:hypothetical protein